MKHTVKSSAGLLLFLAGFLIIGKGLRFALVDDTYTYSRLTIHDMYQQQNIDTLFVGSSHCLNSIDPAVIDRELNISSFNAGTLSQFPDGSLMVIREIEKDNNIQHIYLEMYYYFKEYTRGERDILMQTYYISDYLKPGISKYIYQLRASNSKHYIHSFFPMRRNWETLYSLDQIQQNLTAKSTDDYRNFRPIDGYTDKGFVNFDIEVADWNFFHDKSLITENPMDYHTDDWLEDLQNIIRFCKEHQIELTLFSAPMPDYHLAQYSNYDDYITMLRSLLEGTGISYWDFNLCKEEYFPADSTLYRDDNHLNLNGAEKFSALFVQFLKGEISPEELFYDTYEEKLQHLEPNVLGVVYQNNEDAGDFRSCRIVSTPADDMEYRITIQPAEGEPYLIQDYGNNIDFPLTENGAGKILIRWRIKGQSESFGERIIDFPEK